MKSVSILLAVMATQAIALPSFHLRRDSQMEEQAVAVPADDTTSTGQDVGANNINDASPILPPLAPKTPAVAKRQATSTSRTSTTTSRPTTGTTSKSASTTTRASGGLTVNAITQSTTTTTRASSTTTRAASTSTTTTLRTTTTSSRTTTRSAAAPTRTINVTGMTYQNAMLTAHNAHRANHSISNLIWDTSLAATAQRIAQNCVYGHNVTADGGGYGQNIGAGAIGNAAAGLITNLMYNGEINYYPTPYGNDNPSLDNFHIWGHYSQLVWIDTTNVGCYTQYCPNGLANTGAGVAPYFTVCNYSPPGNYIGEFSSVAAPGGGATLVITGS